MRTAPVPRRESTIKLGVATVDMKLEIVVIAVSGVERARSSHWNGIRSTF